MSLRAIIEGILQAVLTLSVVFVYGVGSLVAFEVEHEHEDAHAPVPSDTAPVSHGHHHHHDHDDHHHGENEDGNDEVPDEENDSPSHKHSHFLSFDTHVASCSSNVPAYKTLICASERLVPEVELCPDGPFYDLSKPPQLG